ISDLRYGENPHQSAAFYKWGGRPTYGLAAAKQIQGKELSYNNLVDAEAAWNLVCEFDSSACSIIKHTNPCGTAIADCLREAYLKAYTADPVSAFGSIIALNRTVDGDTAIELAKLFVEAVIAPASRPEGLAIIAPKKNLRVLSMGGSESGGPQHTTRQSAGSAALSGAERDIERGSGVILLRAADHRS